MTTPPTPTSTELSPLDPIAFDVAWRLQMCLDQSTLHEAMYGERLPPVRLNHYVIRECIGHGGHGVVFRAYDPKLARDVAIKLLRQAGCQRQLIDEARAMARVTHPNIVQVFETGTFEGAAFIVMEYVEGQSLREWLGEPRSLDRVLATMIAAGRGLEAVHQKRLVHCDFKPENVMIGEDGRVLVMDFGIAYGCMKPDDDVAAFHETADLRTAPHRVVPVGTLPYMAPEQLERCEVGVRSDQFSFCVTLWEAVLGERPFQGQSRMSLIAAIIQGDREEPRRDLPRCLRRVLERGLSPAPERRYPTMGALLAELEPARRSHIRRSHRTTTMVAMFGVAMALTLLVARSGRGNQAADARVGERDQGAWSGRVEVERSLRGLELSYADAVADASLHLLDQAALRWPVEGGGSPCEERWAARFAARVDALTRIDEDQALEVYRWLQTLSDGPVCGPSDPLVDLAVEDELDEARTAALLEGPDAAQLHAFQAVEYAKRVVGCDERGHSLDYAVAARELGGYEADRFRARVALDWLDEASEHALACGVEELAISAKLEAARIAGLDLDRHGLASQYRNEAVALIERQGSISARLAFERAEIDGLLAAQIRDREGAGDARMQALRIARDGDLELETQDAYISLAIEGARAGDMNLAQVRLRRAREYAAAHLGHAHPELEMLGLRAAELLYADVGFEAAYELLAQARLSEHAAIAADASVRLINLAMGEGELAKAEGRLAEAEGRFALGHSLGEELLVTVDRGPELGPESTALVLTTVGQLRVGRGDASGRLLLRRAIELWSQHAPDSWERDLCELLLAEHALELGDAAAARYHYEVVAERITEGKTDDWAVINFARQLEGQLATPKEDKQ